MIRKAFVMSVYPEKRAEYIHRHNPIWPELEAVLREHCVSNYSIFHHPDTHQLFAYAEIQSEEQWQRIADTKVCQEWWAAMQDCMPTDADNSPKSELLSEVFHLD